MACIDNRILNILLIEILRVSIVDIDNALIKSTRIVALIFADRLLYFICRSFLRQHVSCNSSTGRLIEATIITFFEVFQVGLLRLLVFSRISASYGSLYIGDTVKHNGTSPKVFPLFQLSLLVRVMSLS